MTLFISNSNPKYPSLHSYIKIKLKRNLFLSPKKKKMLFYQRNQYNKRNNSLFKTLRIKRCSSNIVYIFWKYVSIKKCENACNVV